MLHFLHLGVCRQFWQLLIGVQISQALEVNWGIGAMTLLVYHAESGWEHGCKLLLLLKNFLNCTFGLLFRDVGLMMCDLKDNRCGQCWNIGNEIITNM